MMIADEQTLIEALAALGVRIVCHDYKLFVILPDGRWGYYDIDAGYDAGNPLLVWGDDELDAQTRHGAGVLSDEGMQAYQQARREMLDAFTAKYPNVPIRLDDF